MLMSASNTQISPVAFRTMKDEERKIASIMKMKVIPVLSLSVGAGEIRLDAAAELANREAMSDSARSLEPFFEAVGLAPGKIAMPQRICMLYVEPVGSSVLVRIDDEDLFDDEEKMHLNMLLVDVFMCGMEP